MFPIIAQEDAVLHKFLHSAGVQPYFALPWVLTWFSHSVSSFAMVQRLFDFFLASSDPTMPFLVSVSIVLWSRPHLASLNVECEYSAVHSFYSKLFADIPLSLNLDPHDARHDLRLPALVEADLELILKRARTLSLRYAGMLRESSARPFVEAAEAFAWHRVGGVKLKAVPKNSKQSIVELRYRFEGTLKNRRWHLLTRYSSRLLMVASLIAIVSYFWKVYL
jgi:hypothetical protein